MDKKIMLLALAAASAAVLALPAMASASMPLHLNPTPAGVLHIHGGVVTLNTPGVAFSCKSVTGTLEFESGGATGSMDLIFSGCETPGGFISCKSTDPEGAAKTIKTTTLPFHLVTLANNKPGILITPNQSGTKAFAHLNCAGLLFTWTGNGLIGTIEQGCGVTASSVGINFARTAENKQEHMLVAGTSTVYDLKKGSESLPFVMTNTVTYTQGTKLECT